MRKVVMKSFKVITLQKISRGLVASAVLATGVARAADTPAATPTTQGSGASRLSGNSEQAGTADASGTSMSQDSEKMEMPKDAKSFLQDAIEGNSAEIALAQVAERKAQSADVRQMAQMIRKDHEQANQSLRSLAQAHGVSMNQTVDSKHQKKLDRMQKLSGTEFDKEYSKEMLKDHHKDVQKYEHASKNLTETDVQQYAQATLPKLRQHLQHAQHCAQTVGVDQATISSILKKSDPMGGSKEKSEKTTGSEASDSSTQPNP